VQACKYSVQIWFCNMSCLNRINVLKHTRREFVFKFASALV